MLLHNFQDPDGIGLDSSHTNHRLSTSQASCWPMLVVLLFVLFGSVQLPHFHRSAVVQLPLCTVGVGTSHPSPITSAPYPSHHSRIHHRPTMISQPAMELRPGTPPKQGRREPPPYHTPHLTPATSPSITHSKTPITTDAANGLQHGPIRPAPTGLGSMAPRQPATDPAPDEEPPMSSHRPGQREAISGF